MVIPYTIAADGNVLIKSLVDRREPLPLTVGTHRLVWCFAHAAKGWMHELPLEINNTRKVLERPLIANEGLLPKLTTEEYRMRIAADSRLFTERVCRDRAAAARVRRCRVDHRCRTRPRRSGRTTRVHRAAGARRGSETAVLG